MKLRGSVHFIGNSGLEEIPILFHFLISHSFSLLVFNTSLLCRSSKPASVPRPGCLGLAELQPPHNLSSRRLWSEISATEAAMEEIDLGGVMRVRPVKI